MKRSEQIEQIAKALAGAQKKFTPVTKTKTATILTKTGVSYSYKYADLADILAMAVPILSGEGIGVMQPLERIGGKLYVTILLVHESGEWMQSDGIEIDEMETKYDRDGNAFLARTDPRDFGGDMTYYRRYDGASFLGIAPDEDLDAGHRGAYDSNAKKDRVAPAQASTVQQQLKDSVAQDNGAPAKFNRSTFLTKAKEHGWGLGDVKTYCVKTYPGCKSTGDMTDAQMEAALRIFSKVKPTSEVQGESPEAA